MEERNKGKLKDESLRRLLLLLSTHHDQYQPDQGLKTGKMNQCFSSQVQRNSNGRPPLQPLKQLTSTHLLTKHSNKIQQNIHKHRDQESRATHSRMRKDPQKTQLIINRPFYRKYFSPRTREEILTRHHVKQENATFHTTGQHKASVTSLHQRSDSFSNLPSMLQQLRPTLKGERERKLNRSGKMFKRESIHSMGSTFGSFIDLKKPLPKQFNKEISLYCRKELECFFQSLIKFSKGDAKKYKDGFETMLNLMNITSSEKVVTKEFNLFKKNPTFDEFVEVYTKVVDANLRENVMDFFDIVFEECGHKELTKDELTSLLHKRMPRSQAMDIVDEIFFLFDPEARSISTADILTLCCTNDEFCIFMKQFDILESRKK